MRIQFELYENVSLNVRAANYVKNKMAKSDMLNISCNISETEELDAPFSMLAGKDKNILVIGLDGGADGTKKL